jgi:hypothetical protein
MKPSTQLSLYTMMRPEMRTRCIKTDHLSSSYYSHNYWFSAINKVAQGLNPQDRHNRFYKKHYFFSIRKLTFVNYGAGFHLPLCIYTIYLKITSRFPIVYAATKTSYT